MRTGLKCALLALAAIPAWSIDVGEGAVTEGIRLSFINAYQRGDFRSRHTARDTVKAYGGTGFFQTFTDAQRTSTPAALVYGGQAPGETAIQAFQVYSTLFAYFGTVGTTAAGFPVMDSGFIAAGDEVAGEWALFSKAHALFAWYAPPVSSDPSTGFTVRDPYFTRWTQLGAMASLGAATSAETAVTSPRGGAATRQRFQRGSMHRHTSGLYSGQLFTVLEPILGTWNTQLAEAGFLGHPISDETRLPDGRRQQAFEGGTIVYRAGETPQILPRVTRVYIRSLTTIRLNAGESATLRAEMETVLSQIVSDRPVTWLSSSQRVATVVSTGTASAVVAGVGSGSATITAISESVTSSPITILVTGICCAVGEGAPTSAAVAMEAALFRNGLTIRRPLASAARRSGGAWLQDALGADGRTRYVLVKPDASANAYVVSGDILAVWETQFSSLGFPAGDATSGGRQPFERGTLAGRPVQLVAGSILNRWGIAGFEAGALGDPIQARAQFLSFAASSGAVQNFRSGVIVETRSRALLVSGRIATEYRRLGGPEGRLGAPIGEELLEAGRRRQSFEGGVLSYTDAEPLVALESVARRPQVVISPAVVSPGGRVSISIGGFEDASRVSVSFQPGTASAPFSVNVPSGAFSWELLIPLSARAETVAVVAEDTARPGVSARGSYTVRQPVGSRLTVTGGDAQSGVPGGVLALPLTLRAQSSDGVPLIRQPIRWEASPGAQVLNADAQTNDQGDGRAWLRLPSSEGIAIVTAAVSGQVVTFSARVAGRSLPNFPRLSQALDGNVGSTGATLRERGAQVAALASIIRYRQANGAIPAPQGLADVSRLNDFLRTSCVPDSGTGTLCDGYLLAAASDPYVNLWRLPAFVDGGLEVVAEPADIPRLRDIASADEPALLALAMTVAGQPAGTHFAVLTGVGADGSLLIHDPNPVLGRSSLDAYLNGFTDSQGRPIRATLAAVVRLALRPSPPGGFLASGTGTFRVVSSGGACPANLAWPALGGTFRMTWCDGAQTAYQLDAEADASVTVTSLDSPGERTLLPAAAGSYRVARPATQWRAQPQELSFAAESILHGATFRPGIASGTFFSVFGSGLSGAAVEVAGISASVAFSSPFQLNAIVPAGVPAGSVPVRVRSALGDVIQQTLISRTAPGIFMLGDGGAAVTNQDGTLNRPASPERRGRAIIIYLTGLGATERRGALDWAVDPVRVTMAGRELTPIYAGLTPGFPGLYQVNVLIPSDFPPGLRLPLRLSQAGAEANLIEVSIQ